MNLFGVMDVSGSALKAERVRAAVVASNMANAETTRTADGTPYKRQHVAFEAAGQSFADVMQGQGMHFAAMPGMTPKARVLVGDAAGAVAGGVQVGGIVGDSAPPLV